MGKKMNLTMSTRLEELLAKAKNEEKSNRLNRPLRESHPDLAAEWDYEKNEKTPDEHIRDDESCWWICPECGYSWEATVRMRWHDNKRCPVCHSNIVVKGINDLATLCPELAEQWDYERNDKTPQDYKTGSSQLIWWKCENGHSWEQPIASRVASYQRTGTPVCRYCNGWTEYCGENQRQQKPKRLPLTVSHPELLDEWDYEKNDIAPDEYHPTRTVVWWLCPKCNQSYPQSIGQKIRGGKCLYCYGKRAVAGVSDLATVCPELATQWDYDKNDITPQDIKAGAMFNAWWLCENGHSWQALASNRYRSFQKLGMANCPYCSGHHVAIGETDLFTTHPVLRDWWDFDKNQGYPQPEDVSAGSKHAVYWHCPEGHSYKTRIVNQTRSLGCPICKHEKHTSFPEQAILFFVRRDIDANAESRAKVLCVDGKRYEADIWIESRNIAIEYDGSGYHKGQKLESDARKDRAMADSGIRLIRIKDVDSRDHRHVDAENDRIYYSSYNQLRYLNWAIEQLEILIDGDAHADIDFVPVTPEILSQFRRRVRSFSVASEYPELASEWNYQKNGTLTPEMCAPRSNLAVWWICKKGHEWFISPGGRVHGIPEKGGFISGCPYCARRYPIVGENDLATTHPEILKEWHPTKNGDLTPQDVMATTSKKKVSWICENGHEWVAAPAQRIKNGEIRPCPKCWRAMQKHYNVTPKIKDNNITLTHPELLQEWHPTLNGDLDPQYISEGSKRKIWWRCSLGHCWQTSVKERLRRSKTGKIGTGCPYCSGNRILSGYNDLATRCPDAQNIWDFEKNETDGISIYEIGTSSHKRVAWHCPQCSHEWKAQIVWTIQLKPECPKCHCNLVPNGIHEVNTDIDLDK